MEIKNNPPTGEKEKKDDSLLKRQINNFLINYFSHLISALALIIFIAGLFFFIYPQYQKISENEQTAKKDLLTEYETKNSLLNKVANLKKSYQLISREDRKKIEAMVPADNNITDLIPEIESIILRNSAVLNSIKINLEESRSQPEVESGGDGGEKSLEPQGIFSGKLPPGVELVKIEINLESVSYPVLKNIIKTMENNLRLLDVADINYTVLDNKAILIIYTYYLVS